MSNPINAKGGTNMKKIIALVIGGLCVCAAAFILIKRA
jgi:hypothetical protein